MQFQQLRAFREVAAELSFTRAAKNLHYAQSTVTTQIKNLEEAVGADLFDRSQRQLALTEAGLRLLPHAERIIEIAETARREVASTVRQPRRPTTRRPAATARRALL
ncbi:LysR family transcriptional regulator [Streptomyces sp. NPDC005574]|uniref:LysR family transcriptional regulator n=1 Tax=Streptomyces sp. NPDC005574 TaxID=3156891 RepID=UPI0033B6F69A